MESLQGTIDLLQWVNKSTDNLLEEQACVLYKSGSAMAVVEINVIVQAQHISNRKYNNSHTINVHVGRQMSVSILQCKGNKIPIPHVK
jgi:hypothetical protein